MHSTILEGKVEAVLVSSSLNSTISQPVEKLKVLKGFGIYGDNHSGIRLADAREKDLLDFGLPKGIEIANLREFSAISIEELNNIARNMALPSLIPFGRLGENLVVSGIPNFTQLPIGTKLFFKNPAGKIRTAVLLIWSENTPCVAPGKAIQEHFPDVPNLANLFPKAAADKRGVVGIVYCSGFIDTADTIIAKLP